jgi:Arc/MetJ family transcription regulator
VAAGTPPAHNLAALIPLSLRTTRKPASSQPRSRAPIEIDQEALAVAAEVLGTTTKKDTVNAALREVGQRLVRLRALARLGEMADRGDFDGFLDGKAAYRR